MPFIIITFKKCFQKAEWQLVPGEVRRTAKLGCWPFRSSRISTEAVMKFLWLYLFLCFRLTFKPLFLLYQLFHQSKEMTSKYLHLCEMKACFCNWLLRLSSQDEATSHLIQMRQSQLHFKKAPLTSHKESPKSL